MSKLATLMLVAASLNVAAVTAAEPANVDLSAGYQTPQELMEYARQYNRVAQQLTQAGYIAQGCQHQQLYYLVQPTEAIYLANKVNCTFNIPARNNSLQTEYAHVTVNVHYDQTALLYREGIVSVEYSTVY